jgi:hypothetical protein
VLFMEGRLKFKFLVKLR